MGDEGLREAVEAQARARVRGDMAAFASYMEPKALLELREDGRRAGRGTRYRILDITVNEAGGTSEVEYASFGVRFVIRSRWEPREGHWRVVSAERPPEAERRAWWKRLIESWRHGAPAERQELS